jgi:hypothetical protein
MNYYYNFWGKLDLICYRAFTFEWSMAAIRIPVRQSEATEHEQIQLGGSGRDEVK